MEGFEERWERLREKDRIFDQRMKQMRKEQQESDERWKLLCEEQERLKIEQKNSLERLHKSISCLAQAILERQGIPNASSIASQLFGGTPERKLEVTDPYLQVQREK
ncbi:hypothetical protein M5689_000759 [Euphorbia peplus]|nr:hypothetical protein M5689_000759 [Euphorbia peplus]